MSQTSATREGPDPSLAEQMQQLETAAVRDRQTITELQDQAKLDREQRDLDQQQIGLLEADHSDSWDKIAVLERQASIDGALIQSLRAEGVVGREQIENLETALISARRIGAAVGILMATMKITEDRAFAVLAGASQNGNRKLREIADSVVLTGALPA